MDRSDFIITVYGLVREHNATLRADYGDTMVSRFQKTPLLW